MIRKLIVPAALLALSACAESPTDPSHGRPPARHDANPAFGSGAGLLPPAEAGGQLGSGNDADRSGYVGGGLLTEGDATASSTYVGSGSRTEPPADVAPQLGSGADAEAAGGAMGSGY